MPTGHLSTVQRTAAVATATALALFVLVSASASAALPELVNGSGKELVKRRAVATASLAEFETTGKIVVLCKAATISGEVSGTKKLVKASAHFSGCKLGSMICTPNMTGEFASHELEGELGYVSSTEKTVGLDLWPASRSAKEREKHEFLANVAEFTCGSSISKLRGSVIARLTPVNQKVTTAEHFEMRYAQKSGKQEVTALLGVEGGTRDVLSLSLDERIFPYEETGLEAPAQLRLEEEAELLA